MFVDRMGFEHTGREGFLSRMRLAWDQYELEAQERDAEWEKYFEDHGLDCFEHRKSDPRLLELVNKGFPDKHRQKIWLMLIGYSGRAMPGYYSELLARSSIESPTSQEIAQDLERTFPNHPLLQDHEGRDRLRRVLTAFSMRNPNIGYCQSMNFVCFYLLLVFKDEEKSEEKAFWCLVKIVEELFPEYYTKHMIGSQVDLRCFDELLEHSLPSLYAHMKRIGVLIGVTCASWFLCLFGTTLSAPGVCVVWDNILFRGSHIVMEVGLAVMQQLGDKILLAKNLSDVSKVFGPEALLLDPLPLLLCANAFVHVRPQVQAARMNHWQKISKEIDDLHERRDIKVLRERTGFDGAKLKVLRTEFKALSMDGTGITFLQFQQVLGRVLPHWAGASHTPLERIFEVFDEDADKILSFQELMCGLSILYQGSFDEKLTLIFKSFAKENKDYLSRTEALAMCEHVYKTFYHPSSSAQAQKGDEIRDQLTAIIEKEFATVASSPAPSPPLPPTPSSSSPPTSSLLLSSSPPSPLLSSSSSPSLLSSPPSEDSTSVGLSIDGLRQVVFANPVVLQCFQPFASSAPGTMYTSISRARFADPHDSLHFVDPVAPPPQPPPTRTPPLPTRTPPLPTRQGSLRDLTAFLQPKAPSLKSSPPLKPAKSPLSNRRLDRESSINFFATGMDTDSNNTSNDNDAYGACTIL